MGNAALGRCYWKQLWSQMGMSSHLGTSFLELLAHQNQKSAWVSGRQSQGETAQQITSKLSELKSRWLFPSCFYAPGIQQPLVKVVLASGHEEGCSHLKTLTALGKCFQTGSLMWLLAGGPSSFGGHLFRELLESSHNTEAGSSGVNGVRQANSAQSSLGNHIATSAAPICWKANSLQWGMDTRNRMCESLQVFLHGNSLKGLSLPKGCCKHRHMEEASMD